MKSTYLALALCLLLASCFNPPDFPEEPSIGFVGISGQKIVEPLLGNTLDSITISISFRDGDGDLGLSTNDTLSPYQAFNTVNGRKELNFNHHNFHLAMKRKVGNRIEDVTFLDGGQLRGRFPRLAASQGPIEGQLNYGKSFTVGRAGSPLMPFDTVFFEVRIVDRALHVSNTIETAPIVLGDY